MTKTVKFSEKLPKSKQPSCRSFLSVQSAVNDKFVVAKLQFFSFVANLYKPFLTAYQTDWPVHPSMYGDLIDMARNLLQHFMTLDVLNLCTSGTTLKELDLTKKDNMFSPRKLNIGFATELTMTEMVRKVLVTDAEVSEFKKQCLKFLVATAENFFERSPLGSMIGKHSRCLDPKQFESNAVESMKLLLKRLRFLKVIPATTGDKVLLQFTSYAQNCLLTEPEKIQAFKRTKHRLDHLFFKELTGVSTHK